MLFIVITQAIVFVKKGVTVRGTIDGGQRIALWHFQILC